MNESMRLWVVIHIASILQLNSFILPQFYNSNHSCCLNSTTQLIQMRQYEWQLIHIASFLENDSLYETVYRYSPVEFLWNSIYSLIKTLILYEWWLIHTNYSFVMTHTFIMTHFQSHSWWLFRNDELIHHHELVRDDSFILTTCA